MIFVNDSARGRLPPILAQGFQLAGGVWGLVGGFNFGGAGIDVGLGVDGLVVAVNFQLEAGLVGGLGWLAAQVADSLPGFDGCSNSRQVDLRIEAVVDRLNAPAMFNHQFTTPPG